MSEWKRPTPSTAIRLESRHPRGVQKGDIQPWTLAFRHRRQLVMHRDPQIRETARKLVREGPWRSLEDHCGVSGRSGKTGNAEMGRAVFKSICAKCHKLDGMGAEVGPDLATVRHQPKQVLLLPFWIRANRLHKASRLTLSRRLREPLWMGCWDRKPRPR